MKRYLLLISILALLATPAHAGRWVKTGTTLDAGQLYLVCFFYTSEEAPDSCELVIARGDMEEVDMAVKLFNTEPKVSPWRYKYYHWQDGYWIKYIPPWKYIEMES